MKRFFILSLIVLSATIASLACGPSGRSTYNTFCTYPPSQWNNVGQAEMLKYWSDYVGRPVELYELDFSYLSPDTLHRSKWSDVIVAVNKKGDNETMDYLRAMCEFQRAKYAFSEDRWEYPTPEEKEAATKSLQNLIQKCAAYSRERYHSQYALMQMRCNMILERHDENIRLWEIYEKSLPQTCYKLMMKGVYARALLVKGQRRDALRIYGELGDILSMNHLTRDLQSAKAIPEEYADDPNSPLLTFLVDRYVNSLASTLSSEYISPTDRSATEYEATQFVKYAVDVLQEGKTKNPCMWATAAGYLNGKLGNFNLALDQLTRAIDAQGPEYMKANARVCRIELMASAKRMTKANLDDELLPELVWLKHMADTAPREAVGYPICRGETNHYRQMIVQIFEDRLAPYFVRTGNMCLATAINAVVPAYEDDMYGSYSHIYYILDSLSADDFLKYTTYTRSVPDSKFEAWILSNSASIMSDDYINDRAGTKYMREGKFHTALAYLQKVSLAHLSAEPISYYMANRTYKKDRWMVNQTLDNWFDDQGPTTITENQKALFCKDVVELEDRTALASPSEATARNLYELASLYYQGSYHGNCWYMTRYTQSIYDTVSYDHEADFDVLATKLLRKAYTMSYDYLLREKCLYAIAYIAQYDPWRSVDWWTDKVTINRKSNQYAALSELNAFLAANPGKTSRFVTRCDVLKKFRKYVGSTSAKSRTTSTRTTSTRTSTAKTTTTRKPTTRTSTTKASTTRTTTRRK